jgi:hypothetical protein
MLDASILEAPIGAGGLGVVFGGVEPRSARRADASGEFEGRDVPRAASEASEHGVARPSREKHSAACPRPRCYLNQSG